MDEVDRECGVILTFCNASAHPEWQQKKGNPEGQLINQSSNQSRQNLAFRQKKMREKYAQTNIAALSLPCVLTTTIPDNTSSSRINKKQNSVQKISFK